MFFDIALKLHCSECGSRHQEHIQMHRGEDMKPSSSHRSGSSGAQGPAHLYSIPSGPGTLRSELLLVGTFPTAVNKESTVPPELHRKPRVLPKPWLLRHTGRSHPKSLLLLSPFRKRHMSTSHLQRQFCPHVLLTNTTSCETTGLHWPCSHQ